MHDAALPLAYLLGLMASSRYLRAHIIIIIIIIFFIVIIKGISLCAVLSSEAREGNPNPRHAEEWGLPFMQVFQSDGRGIDLIEGFIGRFAKEQAQYHGSTDSLVQSQIKGITRRKHYTEQQGLKIFVSDAEVILPVLTKTVCVSFCLITLLFV